MPSGLLVIAVLLALLASAGCVWVSAKRLALVSRVERDAIASDGLERASRERLLAKLPAGGELARVAREVLDAPERAAAVACLNEALGDVARELDVSREVPKSAIRVALAAGALFGLVELGRLLPEQGTMALASAGPPFAVGLVGAVVCILIGRAAEERGRRARNGWDRLGRILERLLAESDNVGLGPPQQRVDPGATPD